MGYTSNTDGTNLESGIVYGGRSLVVAALVACSQPTAVKPQLYTIKEEQEE